MADTTVRLSDATIATLRSTVRAARDNDDESALVAAVDEVLALLADDTTREKEYGYRVHLTGTVRTRHRTRTGAALQLGQFQDVDCEVAYGEVTVTGLSIVPDDDITLIDIDGEPIGPRPR